MQRPWYRYGGCTDQSIQSCVLGREQSSCGTWAAGRIIARRHDATPCLSVMILSSLCVPRLLIRIRVESRLRRSPEAFEQGHRMVTLVWRLERTEFYEARVCGGIAIE